MDPWVALAPQAFVCWPQIVELWAVGCLRAGGSGAVVPAHQASPYQAIRKLMGLPPDESRPLGTCSPTTVE